MGGDQATERWGKEEFSAHAGGERKRLVVRAYPSAGSGAEYIARALPLYPGHAKTFPTRGKIQRARVKRFRALNVLFLARRADLARPLEML